MQLKFEKIQELREKFKIESEKQKFLLGVLGKMKESKEGEKWESTLDESETEYLNKQIENLNFHFKIKSEELLHKKASLNEKKLLIQQLEQKISFDPVHLEKPQLSQPYPASQKPQETSPLHTFQSPLTPSTSASSHQTTSQGLLNRSIPQTDANPNTDSNPQTNSDRSNNPTISKPLNSKQAQSKNLKTKKVSIKLDPDDFFSSFS